MVIHSITRKSRAVVVRTPAAQSDETMAEVYGNLRLRDLPNITPRDFSRHFDEWFAERLRRSKAQLSDDAFVEGLKRATRAVLLAPLVEEDLDAETRALDTDIAKVKAWVVVLVPFEGTGETCARVQAAIRWLGLECEHERDGERRRRVRQDQRLIKVRRVNTRRPIEDTPLFETGTDLEELNLEGVVSGRSHHRYPVSCDVCGVENLVEGLEGTCFDIMAHHATDEKYCEECLSSGFCEADPEYGYNWEPYYG